MPLGDHETEILIELDLIGGEQIRLLRAVLVVRRFELRCLGQRRQQRHQHHEGRGEGRAHGAQPSSRWKTRLAPMSQLTPAGSQAASATGIAAASPKANTTSDRK